MEAKKLYTSLIITLLVCFTGFQGIQAQATGNEITVNVNIIPPYSAKIYKYSKLDEKFVVTLMNNTRQTYNVRLKGSIQSDNGVKIATKTSYMPSRPITVPPGVTTLTTSTPGMDLLDEKNVDIEADQGIKNAILKDGIIPEGSYSFCISVIDYYTGEYLSQQYPGGCAIIPISYLQPPIVTYPLDEQNINNDFPQFSWTPVTGNIGNASVMYDLYILKLLPNQVPEDAMMQAVNYNVGNPLKKSLSITNYVYQPSDWPLDTGATYAVQVQARLLNNQQPIVNEGKSEVITFIYSPPALPQPQESPPLTTDQSFTCNCSQSLPSGNAKTGFTINSGFTFDLGEYAVTVGSISSQPGNNGMFSGEGTVDLPIAPGNNCSVEVTFADIQVNNDDEAIAGQAIAKVSQDAGFIPTNPTVDDVIPLSASQAMELDNYFQTHPNKLVSNCSGTSQLLPLGISANTADNQHVIAITGMYFNTVAASFDGMMVLNLPDANPSRVAFTRRNVCFSGSAICDLEGSLFLENDIILDLITMQGNMVLKGYDPALVNPVDSGTYVKFNKDGLVDLRIQADYTFPVEQVVSPDGNSQVIATITASAMEWNNWIGEINFSQGFLSSDLHDFQFDISQPGKFDHSDLANPANLPSFYLNADPLAGSNDWYGVYIPAGQVSFPGNNVELTSSGSIQVQVNDMVIDDQGVSVEVDQTGVFDASVGTIANWQFSMDSLELNLFKNSMTSGRFAGKLLFPIAHDTSYVDYSCILGTDNGDLNYQFLVRKRDNLIVPMWKAKMDIEESSVIDIQLEPGNITASANLNGLLNIKGNVGQLKKLHLKGLEFQNLEFGSVTNTVNIGTCSEGSSGKKKLAGFTLKIMDVNPLSGSKPGIQIRTDLVLFSQMSKPLANTTFSIKGEEDSSGSRYKYVFDNAILDSIKIEGDLSVVKLKGTIVQYDDDPVYGDGFRGFVQAIFPPKEAIKISTTIQFGEISATDTFKYWYVDGMAEIKKGIPIFTGMRAYGFGGGAYYHMERGSIIPEDVTTEDPANFADIGKSPSGVSYTPSKDIGVGIKAAFIFGMDERKTFNADTRLEIELNANGGFNRFMFDGEVKALAKDNKSKDAMIKGLINVEYDHANEVFHANVHGDIKISEGITAEIPLQIHYDPAIWYVWAGRPTPDSARCTLTIAKFANFTSYFQCGNYIDPMPEIPLFIQNILTQANVPSDFLVSERNEILGSQEGMIFGGNMYFNYSGTYLIFKGSLEAGVGFDLAIRKFETDCNGQLSGDLIGVDGWYANGQLYAGIEAMLSVHIDLGFYSSDIKIFEAGAAAVLQGGLVNPTWVKGVIAGYFDILDGLIKGDFYYKFEHGRPCIPLPSDALESLELIANIYPLETPQGNSNEELEIDIYPTAVSNFRISTLPFTLEQADHETGETVNRYFRFTPSNIEIELGEGNQQVGVAKIISSEEYGFMLQPNEMLMPNTTYQLTITATVDERINNQWNIAEKQDGTKFEEVHTISFSTNDGLSKLGADNVKYSLPDDRQRNFSFSEYTEGYIKLNQEINYYHFDIPVDGNDYDIEYFAKFIPMNRPVINPIEIQLQNNYKEFAFDIPANLDPSTIYCIQLLARWTPKQQTQSPFLATMHEMQIWSFDTSTVTKTTREINMENLAIAKNEKNLFSLYFRTSKYGTIAEKLDNLDINETVFATHIAGSDIFDFDYVYLDKQEMSADATMINAIRQKLNVPENKQFGLIYPHDVCMGGDEPFDYVDIYGYELENAYDPNTEPNISFDVFQVENWAQSVYSNINNILTENGDMTDLGIPPYDETVGGYLFDKTLHAPTVDPLTDQEIFDGVEKIVYRDVQNICHDRLQENTVSEAPVQDAASGFVMPMLSGYAYAPATSFNQGNIDNQQGTNAQDPYGIGGYDIERYTFAEPNHISLTYQYRYNAGRGLEMAPNNIIFKALGYTDPSPELGVGFYSNVGQAYDAAQSQLGSVNISSSAVNASVGNNGMNSAGNQFNIGF